MQTRRMDQRLSVVTLAVDDLAAARGFYEALGWRPGFANEEVAFYQLDGMVLGLWGRGQLAKDAGLPPAPAGSVAIALALNVRSRAEVDAALAEAAAAGGRITRAAMESEWGGYNGYFADPAGNPWEVAWNPYWPMDGGGRVRLGR